VRLALVLFAAGPILFSGMARDSLAQQSTDWVSLQGGPEHLGVAPAGVPSPPLASDALWPTGLTSPSHAQSTPAVAGTVAVTVGPSEVAAFNVTSGSLIWSVPRTAGPVQLPAVPPAVDPSGGPAGDGLVVFTEGRGIADSSLVGADLSSGRRLWQVPMGGLALAAPTIADGSAFAASRDGHVIRVELGTGKSQTLPSTGALEGNVDTSPAVSGGKVFVVAENETTGRVRLYALDEVTGETAWSYSPPRTALGVSSATVADGMVYAGFGDLAVRGFVASTGALVWTQPVRDLFSSRSTPSFADGDLFVLDGGGGVYGFEGKSGTRKWDYQFSSFATWGAPLAAGDFLFVGLDDGTLAAIHRGSGHLAWRTLLQGGPVGALAPATGGILLAPLLGQTGGIAALHHADGLLLDERSPTELRLPAALLGFAGAFAAVTVAILLLFRFAVRPRGRREPEGEWFGAAPEPGAGSDDDDDVDVDDDEGGDPPP
jgi:outer membrane protein assembly factor BamB